MQTETVHGSRIRCYDNGGKTYDRFTVVFMDSPEREPGIFTAVGMSEEPFHPLGFGQHTAAMPGKHLGRRVPFVSLPEPCQKLVRADLAA